MVPATTFEELAASLRASDADARALVPVLARKLKEDLGDKVNLFSDIHYSGFLGRHSQEQITGCRLNLGGRQYSIQCQHGNLVVWSEDALQRGGDRRATLGEWLRDVRERVAELAREHEQGLVEMRTALTGMSVDVPRPTLDSVAEPGPLSRPSSLAEVTELGIEP